MAKTLTIKDPVSGESYALEYTRKTVEIMEKQGFIADDVDRKPMTMLPALFAGAFLAHHRWVKKDVIDRIYARLPRKDELLPKLVEMYNEPILSLMEEPEQNGDDEGNMDWTAGRCPADRGAVAAIAPLPVSLTQKSSIRSSPTILLSE